MSDTTDQKSNRGWKISVVGVVVVAAVGWIVWSGPWRSAPARDAVTAAPASGLTMSAAAASTVVGRATAATRVAGHPHSDIPTATPRRSLEARKLFADTTMSLGDRFNALIDEAAGDDPSAQHFALQIANQCQSVTSVPANQPPVGHTHATPYQTQLRAKAQSECAGVVALPEFEQLTGWLKHHSVDALDGYLKHRIRKQFADNGADAALRAGVDAIKSRPDETTAMMVADQLATLDLSSLYLQPAFDSVASVNPAQRNQLVRFALGLLACDYGRPCGPTSFAVRSACYGLGACVPGADLQTVYERELLTGQQSRDVEALLNYFRQLGGIAHANALIARVATIPDAHGAG